MEKQTILSANNLWSLDGELLTVNHRDGQTAVYTVEAAAKTLSNIEAKLELLASGELDDDYTKGQKQAELAQLNRAAQELAIAVRAVAKLQQECDDHFPEMASL